ncbi:MAG: ATP-binding protein [Deltaproteobacteria bacterium]|nr:ATP-binding protein [Deltaproteobacteria bacterium]
MDKKKRPPKQKIRGSMPLELAENLRSLNPWWRGEPGLPLPAFHRWPFSKLKNMVMGGLAPATILRGPRRVGKTVLLRQLVDMFLREGISPSRILYVPFDDLPTLVGLQEPVLSISRWFERNILGQSFNAAAKAGETVFLFFDEVQNLDFWAEQIKNLVDNHAVRIIVTGSSSLRIEGGRDSLAGRVTTLDLGPLLLREIAELRFGESTEPLWPDNGLDHLLKIDFWKEAVNLGQDQKKAREDAFAAFSERGAYPFAQQSRAPWPEVADYLNETVIKRAIQHDLLSGPRGRKRDVELFEELFKLCCRYAGQAPGAHVLVPEIRQALAGNIGWNRILNYLRFLDETLLIRLIQPLEIRLKRKKAPAKVCLCDHALRASWLQESVPLSAEELTANPHLTDLAGHLAESVLGYYLASIPHLDVAYFPARGIEPEVDFVMTVGTRRIPIEVKYRRRIDYHEDTRGLRAFLEKTVYNAPFGLLVTLNDDVTVPDPRIIPISLSCFMWIR